MADPSLSWIDAWGRSGPGQMALFGAAALVALPLPDVDLLALRVLHHRSILTHSPLLPLLLLLPRASWGTAPAAGASLGVAVHLAADVLSPPVGFGRVWLPAPWGGSLGAWSPAWLALSAVLAAAVASRLFLRRPGLSRGEARARQVVAGATAAGAALGYGLVNEGSVAAVAAAAIALALGHGAAGLLARRPPRPGG